MHDHAHDHAGDLGAKRLWIAIVINMLLTVAEVVGGVVSGSLSLIADALHNFSDAAGLVLALVARKIARRPADDIRTFGYGRAEVVGGLINLTAIVVVALYLLVQAVERAFDRPEIEGWTIIIVAGVALVIDLATAVLTYTVSHESVNIRAAFLHNVADALASVAVIVSGVLIILFDWYWTDLAATVGISAYIMVMSWKPLVGSIRILMQSTPEQLSLDDVVAAMRSVDGVEDVFHVHLWPIDERITSLEAKVRVPDTRIAEAEPVLAELRRVLLDRFGIQHVTLELRTEQAAHEQVVMPHKPDA